MNETAHNHPPACCCQGEFTDCPLCVEHGELRQLAEPQPGECPICHSEIGKQHTDYCRFTGIVTALPILDLDQFRTQTAADTCPDRDQHDLMTYCGACHTTFSAAGPSVFRTQTSEPATHARRRIRWHQDGPDSAHERTQCDPAVCGDTPIPALLAAARCPRCGEDTAATSDTCDAPYHRA